MCTDLVQDSGDLFMNGFITCLALPVTGNLWRLLTLTVRSARRAPTPESFAKAYHMIPRYSRPDMVAIWEPENKFRIWFEIEAHATDALAELGVVPQSAAKALWDWWATNPKIDVAAIDAIEAVTKHDVIAFLTWVAEQVGDEARFMHQGMTSSDVLDTCLAAQLTQATDILLADMDALLAAIKTRALEHKFTPTIGRSHGIHGEPVTFGLKLAQAYAEFARSRERLVAARAEIATCAISGAVGTFANIDPKVEAHVAAKLGLAVEPVSTQVIPRDRHAMYFAVLGVVASSIERLAVEIRHLQRTEVLEAEEYFSPGQKGSSAMPHKRNPILTENLTGLARMVRSAVTPAMENVALWHERDISHSSVERYIGPDATITLDFALARLTGVVDKLLVYPARMQKNLDRMGGLVHSQRVLLALTQAGISREDSYAIVQRNAMKVWESDGALSLLELLKADADVAAKMSAAEIEDRFNLDYHFKHVDTIFARVFG
jgi:adenylosuccinate lyase